ncbi:MAG: ATP synthase F1 subunit delta [Leptospira sp.]|nr:ATP synthase F1 subunit delta [Leptospira sp.]
MNQSQVATVYANALLEIAGDGNHLEDIEGELQGVHEAFFTDPEVKHFVLAPILKREDKEVILLKSLQGQVSEVVASFIGILNQKDRMEFFPEICKVFSEGVDRVRGRQVLIVQSKESLSEDSLERIRKTMEEKFKTKVVLKVEINPDIIGGFVLRMSDYLVDASMQSKLSTIKKSLLSKKITVGAIYEN